MKYQVEIKYTNPSHEHVSFRRKVHSVNRLVEASNPDEAVFRATRQQRALGFIVTEAKAIVEEQQPAQMLGEDLSKGTTPTKEPRDKELPGKTNSERKLKRLSGDKSHKQKLVDKVGAKKAAMYKLHGVFPRKTFEEAIQINELSPQLYDDVARARRVQAKRFPKDSSANIRLKNRATFLTQVSKNRQTDIDTNKSLIGLSAATRRTLGYPAEKPAFTKNPKSFVRNELRTVYGIVKEESHDLPDLANFIPRPGATMRDWIAIPVDARHGEESHRQKFRNIFKDIDDKEYDVEVHHGKGNLVPERGLLKRKVEV